MSKNPAAAVVIDGAGVPNVSDRNGLFVVVLQQATRAVLESGTTPRNASGLGQLAAIAKKWQSPDTIMIVSGAKGIARADRQPLEVVSRAIGATPFTDAEMARLADGAPFSMVGYPGEREGSGWTKVAPPLDSGPGGNITGWLQFDPGDGRYNYVTGAFPTYSTSAGGAPERGNVIEVNGKRFAGQLPGGRSNGFHILKLESQSLLLAGNDFVETETYEGQQNLAAELAQAAAPTTPKSTPPLVFVQRIGRPVPGPNGWAAASSTIEKLGGTPLAFLNLGGANDYSLVGSTLSRAAALEGSALLSQAGPLMGVLSPGHQLSYLPLVGGPAGGVNLKQVNLQYQAPTPFPAVNAAAMASIGRQVRLCGVTDDTCDFRQRFGSDYQASWLQIATDVNSDAVKRYPGDGRGFTAAEYEATRLQLATELSMFNQVKNYFTVLQDALDKSGRDARVNVKDLGDAVSDAVKPPAKDKTTIFMIGAIGSILKLGAFAGPPVSSVTGGLSAAFGLAAYMAGKPGDTTLAEAVTDTADSLSRRAQAAIDDAVDSFTTQARIVVTDYGKLTAASTHISNGEWRLPSDPKEYVPLLKTGIRKWFIEALTPVAYPWLVRGTPPPLGPTTANGLRCDIYSGNFPLPDKKVGSSYPWNAMPKSAQMLAIQGWGGGQQPFRATFFSSRATPVMRVIDDAVVARNSMPQSLADTMFGTGRDQLGVNLYEYLSPRYFTGLYNANHGAAFCDLPRRG